MSDNKFTDTLNQLLDQLETVKTEIEKQNARMKQMEASNAELLEALEDCCVISKPKNPACCCPVYRTGKHGGCAENEDGECHIWKVIQKARGQG